MYQISICIPSWCFDTCY